MQTIFVINAIMFVLGGGLMKTDIEISSETKLSDIKDIADSAGIPEKYVYRYGSHKAKIDIKYLSDNKDKPDGKLILVTAINPTPAGEGKTTVSIGLADGLNRLGKKAVLALREPSAGPVFGMKGGATGGGYSQVVPMEDMNLNFTGDLHAITAANNLLSALIDNHIRQQIEPMIDPLTVTFRRCLDVNDRQLRNVVTGLGGKANGFPMQTGFDITAASEVMAILCLSTSLSDLKQKLSNIVVGYDYDSKPVTAGDIKAADSMTILLKDAINPNLVQTIYKTPAFVHGGPFANIAHGCNSILATRMAMKTGDIAVTEAGFGADLGAQKFLDIKCTMAGIKPDAVVIVATLRALKAHGGKKKEELSKEDLKALKKGFGNLQKHIENIKNVYKLPAVVAINIFPTDTEAELSWLKKAVEDMGARVAETRAHGLGAEGAEELAKTCLEALGDKSDFTHSYDLNDSIKDKIEAIATKIYGADGVQYDSKALSQINKYEKAGYGKMPICIAKTQYSLSDDAKVLGRPQGFKLNVREVKLSAGAGFLVVMTGEILTMPGLPSVPAACNMTIDDEGNIKGLF